MHLTFAVGVNHRSEGDRTLSFATVPSLIEPMNHTACLQDLVHKQPRTLSGGFCLERASSSAPGDRSDAASSPLRGGVTREVKLGARDQPVMAGVGSLSAPHPTPLHTPLSSQPVSDAASPLSPAPFQYMDLHGNPSLLLLPSLSLGGQWVSSSWGTGGPGLGRRVTWRSWHNLVMLAHSLHSGHSSGCKAWPGA